MLFFARINLTTPLTHPIKSSMNVYFLIFIIVFNRIDLSTRGTSADSFFSTKKKTKTMSMIERKCLVDIKNQVRIASHLTDVSYFRASETRVMWKFLSCQPTRLLTKKRKMIFNEIFFSTIINRIPFVTKNSNLARCFYRKVR